ncbi:endolytic transglycosylase MltG [Zhouia sp. PK063]|uniref:endolytic transglycosylase MltG n=1 Tax=Zhouia sp. PK063 TaxID=3373602 RepID=UPI003798F83F
MYIKKLILIIALMGVAGGGIFVYYIYNSIFSANTAFNNKEAYVYVKTGDNFIDVTNQIEPLIKNINSFEEVAKRKGYINNVKAGRYIIKKGMNNNEIINTLRSKNAPLNVTFNNQELLEDFAGRIAGQIEADSTSLMNAYLDPAFLKNNGLTKYDVLAINLPNSYQFFWNTSATSFRDRMLAEYKKFWSPERKAKAQALGLTPMQVITLASIVNKETVKVEERPRVAGVYLNRLKANMPLQADPTVIFAIKKHTGDFNQVIKRVLYKDLNVDSPYNTYLNTGLPPGPIYMPDLSSIKAVLNAEKNDYYYFVADVTRFGYHKFAKTLAQHNINKQAYVQWLSKQNIKR